MKLFTRTLSLFALALVLAVGAYAQGEMPAPPAPEPTTASADDPRAQYAAAVEEAQAATAQGTAAGHVAGGEAYLRAAEVAETSGDDELSVNARGAREAAIRAFVDAGSTHAGSQAFGEAASQFSRAAEIAAQIGDDDTEARVTYNAASAFMQAEQFGQAIPLFDRALELRPDNLDYAFVRAVALRGSGDTDAAMAAFAELSARAEAAGNTELQTRIGETAGRVHLVEARDAIQAQNWRGAIAALDQAARFLPANDANLNTFYANAYYRLGVQQVQAEQWAAARTSLQRAQQHARTAGRDQIVQGAQQQLDYIRQVQG
jgi:tetratricopeptide (TPR) repeat protein